MRSLNKFLLRAILAVLLAWGIDRLYFQGTEILRMAGVALVLFVLAYLFEYTKKRNSGG